MNDEDPDPALMSLALIVLIALYLMAAYAVASMHLAYDG